MSIVNARNFENKKHKTNLGQLSGAYMEMKGLGKRVKGSVSLKGVALLLFI